MSTQGGVTLSLGGHERLRRAFSGRRHSHRALRGAWKQNGTRYLAFTKRRMIKESRGGGSWKPLAASTLRSRRKGKGGKSPRILWDSGALIASLDVGAAGNELEVLDKGVKVGFSGTHRHPDGDATMADIAAFHDQGGAGGRPPQRKILVEPDTSTARQMRGDWEQAGQELLRDAEEAT